MSNQRTPLAERFWSRVNKTDGCWTWTGWISTACSKTNPDRGRYGRLDVNGRQLMAHRVAWELLNGAIPDGMTLDHLCLNKRCVNPAHLEVVTRGENSRRHWLSRTHCKHGHPYDELNTMTCFKGHRACRTCMRGHWKKQHDKVQREIVLRREADANASRPADNGDSE